MVTSVGVFLLIPRHFTTKEELPASNQKRAFSEGVIMRILSHREKFFLVFTLGIICTFIFWSTDTLSERRLKSDSDGDRYSVEDGDCDDKDASIHPGASELCDGKDNDCDGFVDGNDSDAAGRWCYDYDGDGFTRKQGDCNDANYSVHPNAEEIFDGMDTNCDGVLAEGEIWGDADSDGVAAQDGDCHDENPNIYPGALEICNGLDDNCDGIIPEQEKDYDNDRHLACRKVITISPMTWSISFDCDDEHDGIHPGSREVCDGLDNNCDGQLGEQEVDDDGDGFLACKPNSWSRHQYQDCDDTNFWVQPREMWHHQSDRRCDGINMDCEDPEEFARREVDKDGDGYVECWPWVGEIGAVVGGGDCDDSSPDFLPGTIDICDGFDNDCDGLFDEDCQLTEK